MNRYQPIVQLGHDRKLCKVVSQTADFGGGTNWRGERFQLLRTMFGEVKEGREIPKNTRVEPTRVRELGVRIAQVVEELMGQRLNRRKTVGGRVFEQPGNQVDRIRCCLTEDLDISLVNT